MKNLLFLALLLFSAAASAQTFGNPAEYKGIGTYDSWPRSPFRDGTLQGNALVIDNPFKDSKNPTAKCVAYQRSRWASNMYGVRVDLAKPFELTPTAKYIHAYIRKPKEGRVMCIGLGKQRGNDAQSDDVEQFYAMPTQAVGTDSWQDAVFAVRGAGNIDILSLVFVTDLESTDALTEDHIAYIDEITVSDNPTPRIFTSYYAVAVADGRMPERDDFSLVALTLTGSESGEHIISIGKDAICRRMLDTVVSMKAGETITPTVSHDGRTMNAYYYLDTNDNGLFDVNTSVITKDSPAPVGSELLSFSFLEEKVGEYGFNSLGKRVPRPKRDNIDAPAFTIPADMRPGLYRMRVKFDMANGEPAGRVGDSDGIAHNGGLIIDFMVNIMADNGIVSQNGLNGDLCLPDGTILNDKPFACGQDLTIKQVPAPGFVPGKVTVRYGYNLDGAAVVRDNPQWREVTFDPSQTNDAGLLTIPAKYTYGNMRLQSDFIEKKK